MSQATHFFNDAKTLITHAESSLAKIEGVYKEALHSKTIPVVLLVEIKNLMENVRSALDFSAHGLFDKYGQAPKANPKIYFPYALEGQTLIDFRQNNRIEQCIPGLTANRPDITAKIESYQAFSGAKNVWLPRFMDLNNENKHQRLTPQERNEQKELRISSGGASISMGEGASISMGHGTSIAFGGLVIPGGQVIGTDNPPRTIGQGSVSVITWVSFKFSTNQESVVPFLKNAISGVKQIVNELEPL